MSNRPTPKSPGLWQRLRAGRAYASLTQAALKKKLEEHGIVINRTLISQWEQPDEALRTHPSLDALVAVCKIYRIPIEWMTDDAQSPEGLYAYLQAHRDRTPPAVAVPSEAARGRAFWSVAKGTAIMADEALEKRLDVKVPLLGAMLHAPFLHGRKLAAFTADTLDDWRSVIVREAAQLLVLEKVLGYPCVKTLFMWTPTADGLPVDAITSFAERLDLRIVVAHDVALAAQQIAAL